MYIVCGYYIDMDMWHRAISLYNSAPLPPKKKMAEGDDHTGDMESGSAKSILKSRQAVQGMLLDNIHTARKGSRI